MKRRYAIAAIRQTNGGHGVLLDGTPLKTPAGRDLVVPGAALAAAIAAEWNAQPDAFDPSAMGLTALAGFALDRLALDRPLALGRLARYAETDLLCYRAEYPEALIERQQKAWQPLLDWVEMRYEAPLLVTTGVIPKPQSDRSLCALARALEGLDDFSLAALSSIAGASGSLVIALALLAGRIDAEAAFALATLEERFAGESWGEDEWEAGRRREKARGLRTAARFLALLRA